MQKKLILMFALVFLLTGCGVKDMIEDKVSEKITEKVIEGVAGDENTDIDIDGDTIKITSEDGVEATIGSGQWPEIDIIPEFEEGKISSVFHDGENSAMIMIEEVDSSEFEEYLETIKSDFTENTFELNEEDIISYAGENSKGYYVQLIYDGQNSTLSITATKQEE